MPPKKKSAGKSEEAEEKLNATVEESLIAKIDKLLQGQSDLQRTQGELNTNFLQFKEHVQERLDAFDAKLTSVEVSAQSNTNDISNHKITIANVSTKVTELEKLCEFVSTSYDEMAVEFRNASNNLAETQKQNEALKRKIKELNNDFRYEQRTRILNQQYSNNNKLEIAGIPFDEKKDKISICHKELVCKVAQQAGVEMDISEEDVAHRLPSSPTTVIVQFCSRTARNRLWFGKTGLKGKKVMDIGFDKPAGSAGNIFINESLCPYNKTLLKSVQQHCDNIGIPRRNIFTRKGIVNVKVGEETRQVKFLEDIDYI